MSNGKQRTTAGRGRLYDSIIDTVGDTPCVRINRLAPDHVQIYAKAEFFNPGRIGEGPPGRQHHRGCRARGTLRAGQTVVEATSGNTGIGLAWFAPPRDIRWS
jgi:cysteine synthase A